MQKDKHTFSCASKQMVPKQGCSKTGYVYNIWRGFEHPQFEIYGSVPECWCCKIVIEHHTMGLMFKADKDQFGMTQRTTPMLTQFNINKSPSPNCLCMTPPQKILIGDGVPATCFAPKAFRWRSSSRICPKISSKLSLQLKDLCTCSLRQQRFPRCLGYHKIMN